MDEGFRLETERLLLRPYRLEDLDDLHAMFSDPEHMRWYPEPFSREGSLEWLERQIARHETRGYALWIVEDRRTGAFLGTAGPALVTIEEADEVEIGWHTRPGRSVSRSMNASTSGSPTSNCWREMSRISLSVVSGNTPTQKAE